MPVLVAGGAGYLGSRLIESLTKQGEDVRIMDNMFRERYCSLWNRQGIEFYEGDVRDADDVTTCLEGVDTVFCLADITNAAESFEREELTRAVNFEGVTHLFEQAAEGDVDRFIYTSSASVYGNTPGVVDESFDCDPISPYGREKLRAEQHMLEAASDARMDVVALRLGTVHGYSVGMRFDTVVNYFTYLASQGKPLTVHRSALEEYRPYVNVEDVVRAYRFAARNADQMDGDTFNVIGRNATMGEVLDVLQKVFQNVDIDHCENPTENKVSYRLSDEKIAEHGFETRHTLEDGVRSIKQRLDHVQPVP